MERRYGRGFNAVAKKELWDRWRRGESLKAIGRAFGKPSSSIYFQVSLHGGFSPPPAVYHPCFATRLGGVSAGSEIQGWRDFLPHRDGRRGEIRVGEGPNGNGDVSRKACALPVDGGAACRTEMKGQRVAAFSCPHPRRCSIRGPLPWRPFRGAAGTARTPRARRAAGTARRERRRGTARPSRPAGSSRTARAPRPARSNGIVGTGGAARPPRIKRLACAQPRNVRPGKPMRTRLQPRRKACLRYLPGRKHQPQTKHRGRDSHLQQHAGTGARAVHAAVSARRAS